MSTPATRLNGAQVTSLVSCPVAAGAAGLWWDGNTTGPLWRKASGADVTLGAGGGGAATLALLYAAGAATTDSIFSLDSTRGKFVVMDNATPIGGLLDIQASTGTSKFLFDASNMTFGANRGILTVAGIGAFDFSNATGIFKTSTGSHTFGSATWSVPANTVITGGSSATSTTAITLASNVADGASSIGLLISNVTSLANAGAKLVSVKNSSSEKLFLDKDGTVNLTKLTFIGGGTSLTLGGAATQSTGAFRADSDNARDLGTSGTQWTQTFCGFYGTRTPGTLASAATITPTQMFHKVSGAATVSTIATGSLPSGFIGWLSLWCTGAVVFATGGNITSTGFTATAGKVYQFFFDGTNFAVQGGG